MRRALLLTLTTIGMLFFAGITIAQDVFNPSDPVYTYNSADPAGSNTNPNTPATNTMAKWVRTIRRIGWNSSNFKCYYYNGMAFRLRFPNNYNPANASKYPVLVFFHGGGEIGPVTDNEDHIYWGAQKFEQRINQGEWNGFLLFPQETAVGWDDGYFSRINSVLDTLSKYNNLDLDRVISMGLSMGGNGSIFYAQAHPKRVASVISTSPAFVGGYGSQSGDFVHVPLWVGNGGNDTRPTPGEVTSFVNQFRNAGGNLRQEYFPTLDHVCWNEHWDKRDTDNQYLLSKYWNSAHKAQPVVFFQRSQFCIDSALVAKIGISPGYAQYEWQRKDLAAGASFTTILLSNTANELSPTQFGEYRVRFKRTASSNWSDWSPTPVAITSKPLTTTPPITVTPIHSKVLPAPDGSTNVQLELPEEFIQYEWRRVSDNALVSTNRTYTATTGVYRAKVKEQFGCGATFSPDFKVVDANGIPKPDAAKNLTAFGLSKTSIQLDWNNSSNPANNETGFEIYRALKAGGPYTLIKITAPDVVSFTDTDLATNTNYFYQVRAVNDNGAAGLSNEATAKTIVDVTAPTAPSNLTVVYSTRTYIELSWNSSKDDVGVHRYDVYVDGKKMYTTGDTSFILNNLASLQSYAITVKARDLAGNTSIQSNQAIGSTVLNGLRYEYYEGIWDVLPDFNSLGAPLKKGTTPNVNINIRPSGVDIRYGIIWKGFIRITTPGNYTFFTSSDDGSKLYVGSEIYNFSTPALVSNDFLQGCTERSGVYNFSAAGVYPIIITYFNKDGGFCMSASYSGPGVSKQVIPASAFADTYSVPGTTPTAPGSLTATAAGYNKINLSWSDNSANETGFEIQRATAANGPFTSIATTVENETQYTDSLLNPVTKYFYQVRAINASGLSAFNFAFTDVNWRMNGNLTDSEGNAGRTMVAQGSGLGNIYDAADKQEGSHSMTFTSTNNNYTTINNSGSGGFPGTGGYAARTVALWIKPASTTNLRTIFEFGGNDNGIALRINSGSLQARVVSSVSGSAVGTSISATMSAGNGWITAGWNHVAVVFSANSLQLYINGVLRQSGTPAFALLNTSTSSSQFGYPSGSNPFNDGAGSYSYYNGQMDNVFVINGALDATELTTLMDDSFKQSSATTSALPAAPAVPTGIAALVASVSQINLSWTPAPAGTETGFEIYRSANNNSNYRLVKTVAAGTGNYADTGLFANVTYYYKVRAINESNNSAYTAEVSGKTKNTKPVITKVFDFTMRYGITMNVPLLATDPDRDDLVFTTAGLPSFGTIVNVSNGNANLVLSPKDYNQGTYNIRVYVNDGNNGKDTMKFILVINENTAPLLNAISNASVNEGGNVVVNMTGTDAENISALRWSFTGLPGFASFVKDNAGHGTITFTPGFSTAASYPVTVRLDDGFGAWTTRTFNLTVNDVRPNEKWLVNIQYNAAGAGPTPWNNMTGNSISNLRNTSNTTTGVGITTSPANAFNARWEGGKTTGNNSGIYPDAVLKDYVEFGAPYGTDTVSVTVSGLNPAKLYNFKFLASSAYANPTTVFAIGARKDSISVQNNTSTRAVLTGNSPNAAGQIVFRMYKAAGAGTLSFLNAFEIEAVYDDGTLPSKPLNLTGTYVNGSGAKLNWSDVAYNESAYRVYRSTTRNGAYTNLNPGVSNPDDVTYTDKTTVPSNTYFYYVMAANNTGNSPASDTIIINAGNNAPVFSEVGALYVKTTQDASSNFSVTDDAGDVVTMTAQNLPSFLKLESMGAGVYRLITNPVATNNDLGWYTITLVATDDKGSVSTKTVSAVVSDINATRTVLVNFGSVGKTAPTPWNNILGDLYIGRTVNGIRDDAGNNTTVGLSNGNNYISTQDNGHITGNASGIVPDSVLQGYIFNSTNATQSFTLTGLDNSKLYSIGLISSVNEGSSFAGTFATTAGGGQSVSVEGRYLTNQMSRLNGLAPTGGQITLSMTKAAQARWIAMNGLIIQEYTAAVGMLSPTDLFVEATGKTGIRLTWTDRSNNEDNFVLERGTSLANMVELAPAQSANTTSFTDNSVSANNRYFYRVRARQGASTYSDYTNFDSVTTPDRIVYVNLTNNQSAAAPWNNTSAAPVNASIKGLLNDNGLNSGAQLDFDKPFTSSNAFGVNTGTNSGIFPDNVIASNYSLNSNETAVVKLSGLDHTKRYRIGFSGSAGAYGDFTTTYTIGNRKVYLNAYNNSTKAMYIGNVLPDIDGEVLVTVSTAAGAVAAATNAIIIYAYTDSISNFDPLMPDGGALNNSITAEETKVGGNEAQNGTVEISRAYPNPFSDWLNVEFINTVNNGHIALEIFDVNGRKVMVQEIGASPAGRMVIKLNMSARTLNPGVYMARLNVNGLPSKVVKLIKAVK
ncbi:MAG: fibronectin type III domain-containing protein [Gemmatimonadaceae bacterium]|nr:fibronectin type III domain-containing protein [Chitinophagaceae bacterium]